MLHLATTNEKTVYHVPLDSSLYNDLAAKGTHAEWYIHDITAAHRLVSAWSWDADTKVEDAKGRECEKYVREWDRRKQFWAARARWRDSTDMARARVEVPLLYETASEAE